MATSPEPDATCLHLRCKRMLYEAEGEGPERVAPRSAASDTGVCWCGRTQTGRGPDEQPAGKELCVPSRSCYAGF